MKFAVAAAAMIPTLECGLGVGLLVSPIALAVSAGVIGLLVAFSIVIMASLARGRSIACGCGVGGRDAEIGWDVVARNLFLISAAAFSAAVGNDLAGAQLSELVPLVLTSVALAGLVIIFAPLSRLVGGVFPAKAFIAGHRFAVRGSRAGRLP